MNVCYNYGTKMQSKAKKFFVSLAVLALGFGSLPAAFAGELSAPEFTQRQSLPAQIKIVVTEAKLIGSELAVQAGQASFTLVGCQIAVSQAGLVQDQAVVNLHQLANCFTLTPAKNSASQIKLSVQPLYKIEQRVVALPSARISSAHYSQAPSLPIFSQAPLPVFALLMVFMAAGLGIRASKLKKASLSAIKQALSLEQLQMLRC